MTAIKSPNNFFHPLLLFISIIPEIIPWLVLLKGMKVTDKLIQSI